MSLATSFPFSLISKWIEPSEVGHQRSRVVNETHVEHSASHAATNTRMNRTTACTRVWLSLGAGDAVLDDDARGRNEARVGNSDGDECERGGGDALPGLRGGGKKKDLVDHDRFSAPSPAACSRKADFAAVGVDGGVFAEARTSN